jgi:alpha-L-arabinofuranosidase
MISRNLQPRFVPTTVSGSTQLQASATQSEDGKTLVVQVVNLSEKPVAVQLGLKGYRPTNPVALVETLSAPLDAANSAAQPQSVAPKQSEWRHDLSEGSARYTFSPFSFTVLRFE